MGETDRIGTGIRFYTAQAQPVLEALARDGVCYSKAEFVRRKYEESADIFLTAYSWYAEEAETYVKKPVGAAFPYWAFADPRSVDGSGGGTFLSLCVPKDEVLLFDAKDWNKILCLSYIGETAAKEQAFAEELKARGLDTNKVMLTAFYPEWKAAIMDSWKRLFRHHKALLLGDTSGVSSVQAGLWRICAEWVIK